MNYRSLRQFMRKEAASSALQDFAGGIDPFGTFTSQYGQSAQREGVSKQEHSKKRAVSTVGGLVGGGILLPGAISGTIDAAKGLARQGTVSQRLGRGVTGAVRGFKAPFQGLHRAYKTKRALSSAAQGERLNSSQIQGVKNILGKTSITDAAAAAGGQPVGGVSGLLAGLKSKKVLRNLDRGIISPELAAQAAPKVQGAINEGVATLGMGAGVGGLGAYVQYGKGVDAEKKFQRRMDKNSSALNYSGLRRLLEDS